VAAQGTVLVAVPESVQVALLGVILKAVPEAPVWKPSHEEVSLKKYGIIVE